MDQLSNHGMGAQNQNKTNKQEIQVLFVVSV